MLSAMLSRIVILVFGTLYPAFASYKAVKTKDIREYVKWMMYWIVFAFFTCMETVTDLFLAWFPFYYEVKILLVVWLLSPATRGSSILYKKFVHPWLERNEEEIERYIERASRQGYSAVMSLSVRGVNYATQLVMQSAIRGGGGLVDHLRRSYSVNDVTDLAAASGDLNSNVKRLPPLLDAAEEMGSDVEMEADTVSAPVTAAAEPKRRTRRPRAEAAPSAAASRRRRPVSDLPPIPASHLPPITASPAVWEQAQSMEDVSSGYNSGEPFYDAVNPGEDEDVVTWPSQRTAAAPTARASMRRPPLHAPRPGGRVKSSAHTDVSGYATLPRSSRRTATRKPIPKYD